MGAAGARGRACDAGTPANGVSVETRWSEERSTLLLVVGDAVVALLAYAAAFALRIWVPIPFTTSLLPPDRAALLHHALPIAVATQVPLLYLFGLYDSRYLQRGARLLLTPASALGIQLLVIAAAYFFRSDLVFPRSVLVLFTVFNVAGVAGLRVVARRRLARVKPRTRIALVGAAADVADFRSALAATDPAGRRYEVVATGPADDPGSIAAFARGDVDELILVGAESWQAAFLGQLLFDGSTRTRPRVAVVPNVYDLLVGRLSSLQVADVPLIEVLRDPSGSPAWLVKTVFDYLLALALAIVTLPVCLLAMLAIVLTSPGPVLFRQRRVGRAGEPFVMYKLRTMRRDAEAESGPTLAEDGDERVTAVGRFLRATRIDEIPQLVNVLNGTMSLIGPRPERPEFVARYEREIPGYGERWLVKPGLTGLAQVRGEYHTPAAYKLKYDLAYIYNHSLLLDLRILAETLKVLLTHRGV